MLAVVIFLIQSSITLRSVVCDNEALWRPLDKTGWIDPTDLKGRRFGTAEQIEVQKLLEENHHLRWRVTELERSSSSIQVQTTNPTCDRSAVVDLANKEDVVFKHLIRKLSTKFTAPDTYVADIRFTKLVWKRWHDFLSDSTVETKSLQDVAESVVDLFYRITQKNESVIEPTYFDSLIDFVKSFTPLLNFCLIVPATALLLVHILRISRFQLAMWILFLVFFVSVIWTWIHLYRERLAEMQARFAKRPDALETCRPNADVPVWRALKNYVNSWFSFKPDDPCVEYFKDVMVDPLWTVTPLEAVSVAVTKFFVRPLEPLADGISRFWRALLKDLPLPAYCIVIPFMGCALAFLILTFCGYRLRIGFGLISLEPGARYSDRIQPRSPNHRSTARVETRTVEALTWTRTDRCARPTSPARRVSQGRSHTRRNSLS